MLASEVVEVVRQVAATDPATCDGVDLRSLASDVASVAVLVGLGRRGGGRTVGRAGVGWGSAFVTRGGRADRAGWGVCGDARGARRVGCGRAVSGSCRRDRPGSQPSRRVRAGGVGGAGAEPGRAGGRDVGGRVRPPRPRPRPTHLARRRPAPPREAPVTANGSSLDGPRGHVPHPDQPRPRSRRPVVRRVRRRRGRGEGQARRRPHVRPVESRCVHGDRDRDAGAGITTSGRAPGAHRPRDAPQRAPRVGRVRDVRRPATPTGNDQAAGVRGRHHPDRVGRRRQGRRRRPSQTLRQSPTNAEHYERCIRPAPHPTAPSASATATSTTSTNGTKEGQPTSRT